MDVNRLTHLIKKFRDDREWAQFHTPQNLAITLVLEAGEVLEHFQWTRTDASPARGIERRDAIQDEIGDVLICALELASTLGIDPEEAIIQKLRKNAERYPVAKARGNSAKYDEL